MKRFIISISVLAFISTTSLALAQSKVVVGEPSWPAAKIIATLIEVVIEDILGGEADRAPGSNAVIFAAMDGGKGDIDVHPDVWLPNQSSFTDEYVDEKGTVALSSGGYEGSAGFCTPTHTAEALNITSIFDLATPDAQAAFDSDGDGMGEVWVGAAGWASTNTHRVKVRDYGIETFLEPGIEDEAVFYAKLKDLYEDEENAVFYCYAPHYVHALYDVTMIPEPEYDADLHNMVQPDQDADWFDKSSITVGESVKTVKIAYSLSLEERAPEVANFLSNMDLSADDVSLWTFEVVNNEKDPYDVVRAWIDANGDTVDGWLGIN